MHQRRIAGLASHVASPSQPPPADSHPHLQRDAAQISAAHKSLGWSMLYDDLPRDGTIFAPRNSSVPVAGFEKVLAKLAKDVLLPGRGCAHHHVERVVAATRHGPSPRSLESTPPDSRDADKTIPSIPSSR